MTAGIGHNSIAGDALKGYVERIESLEDTKKDVAEDIKAVYAGAAASGFDAKVLRKVVWLRKQDADKRRAEQEMLDLYLNALGILD